MNRKTTTLLVLSVALAWTSLAAQDSPTGTRSSIRKAYKGCPRPVCYARPCDEMYPSGEIRLFDDKHLRKPVGELNIFRMEENKVHDLPKYKVSSLGWRLPPGVVVVFYDETKYEDDWPGSQYTIWGHGADDDLKDDEFNDEMSAWSWHYVGR
ncbi:MAG: hypothetical protein MI923_19900 [Phycisphaerales bacterium]|nr:hypothetical protein [Phycisphaerales bacterium]